MNDYFSSSLSPLIGVACREKAGPNCERREDLLYSAQFKILMLEFIDKAEVSECQPKPDLSNGRDRVHGWK